MGVVKIPKSLILKRRLIYENMSTPQHRLILVVVITAVNHAPRAGFFC